MHHNNKLYLCCTQLHLLIIDNMRVFVTTTISSLAFLISVVIYATMIYYEDRKALLYNSNWIHRDEDIDFFQGVCACA